MSADAAWVAGFFDGEGSISVGFRKPKKNRSGWFALQVSITNTHRGALERVKAEFGGCLTTRPPYPGRRQIHQWRITDRAAERFLRGIVEYLVIKRPQAELALEFRGLGQRKAFELVPMEHYRRADEISAAIRALNGGHARKADAKVVPLDYVAQAA